MSGATLAAGVPASGQLSAHPYDAAQALREHLACILAMIDPRGRAHFGYNHSGLSVDDNSARIIGARFYLLHSGDLAFIRECLPALERMLAYFVERRNQQGLFKLDDVGAHWYYDDIVTGGVNGYYNAFFYKAALDLAEMEAAAGCRTRPDSIENWPNRSKRRLTACCGRKMSPGGPRYLDWIDAKGQRSLVFLRSVPMAARGCGDRLARTGPQDRRHGRCPHRPTGKGVRLPGLRGPVGPVASDAGC